MTDYNKIITTVNSITSDYTFIPDENNTIVIDTSENRIGINTMTPDESIHVSGGKIKTKDLHVLDSATFDGDTLFNGQVHFPPSVYRNIADEVAREDAGITTYNETDGVNGEGTNVTINTSTLSINANSKVTIETSEEVVINGQLKMNSNQTIDTKTINDLSYTQNAIVVSPPSPESYNKPYNDPTKISNIYTTNIFADAIYCRKIMSIGDPNCYIEFRPPTGVPNNYLPNSQSHEIWVHSNFNYWNTNTYDFNNYFDATGDAFNFSSPPYGQEGTLLGQSPYIYSDDRLKHNERDISNSLNIIKKLNPCTYDMTTTFYDASYVGDISGRYNHRGGFIAQEIKKIEEISFCCIGEEYDSSNNPRALAIDYNTIFTYNVAATQELDILVKNLSDNLLTANNRIMQLENENNTIKTALNTLLASGGYNTI